MIDLNKEAEEYAKRFQEKEDYGYNGESCSIEDRIEMEAFIAGANSKYVQVKIIQAQIEILETLYYGIDLNDPEILQWYEDLHGVMKTTLAEELSKLENEKDI